VAVRQPFTLQIFSDLVTAFCAPAGIDLVIVIVGHGNACPRAATYSRYHSSRLS
jgi:hypothetical protein